MKIGIITQARTTSTRLPGKVLLDAAGRTMLDHHLDRLAQTGLPVIVATTTNTTDDPIVTLAENRGIPAHRGSEDDVLARFAGAIRDTGLETVVRVTSDCPLIDGALIERGIRRYFEIDDPHAFVSNTIDRTYPRGLDFEVFSAVALLDAADAATAPFEREHVTPRLYRSGHATLHAIRRAQDASHHRITLDTEDDLRLLRTLIEDHHATTLDAESIITLLEHHPELTAINAHIEQKKLGE